MKTELLLLAAGQSKRFAGIKQLADIKGQPLVCHCLSMYQQDGNWLEGLANGVVVLGANGNKIYDVLPEHIDSYLAQSWTKGMGHSLAESMQVLSQDTSHVFIGLADQVALTQSHIVELLNTSELHPEHIVAAKYAGIVGAPAIFPKKHFSQLAGLNGDKGAKRILELYASQLIKIPIPEAAMDIDIQDDLKYLNVTLY